MNKKLIAYYVIFYCGIVMLLNGIAGIIDLEFTHFEDGSGRITYCLPFEICND